jgi:3-oxoacyl-[acyl-carrier-protein] synthase-1
MHTGTKKPAVRMLPRVFVTGIGVVTAAGNGIDETLDSFNNLRSGIGRLSRFRSIHDNIPVAEVKLSDEELSSLNNIDDPRKYTRNTLLAITAAGQAIKSAGWLPSKDRYTGAVFANTTGGMDFNEKYYSELLKSGEHREFLELFDSADSGEKTAARFGINHNITTVSTACSSSANAIMTGARLIRNGVMKRVLAGGSDALTKFTLNGFFMFEILSATGCRPFDKARNGLTIGEGAAFLTLESEEIADPSRILGEVTGFANANEAFHATSSTAEGTGAALAMSRALDSASLDPSEISYINAHGTGTEVNDLSEGTAIMRVFSRNIPPVSSTKAFTGHTLGAAGAVEAVFSILALRHQITLPGLNFSEKMPELSFVPVVAASSQAVKHVMSNSFGFGGSNTTLIFSKV